MIKIERDVIVVGAGPAGAICAAYLAKAGVDVLLIDKEHFPRDKACGDLLREGIVSHINALGAIDALDKMSTCIRNLQLVSDKGMAATVPFECYCTPRYKLDALLTDAALRWGAEFRQGCRALDVLEENGAICGVKIRECGVETELRSKLVIGADGAYSVIAKKLGLAKEKPQSLLLGQRAYFKGIHLERSLAKEQYDAYGILCFDELVKPCCLWVMPTGAAGVSGGYCNVGLMVLDRNAYRGIDLTERFFRILEHSPKMAAMFEAAEQITPWKSGQLSDVTQDMQRCVNGAMLIGDAASVMMPLMNDGLSAAADSARAAAEAALQALEMNCLSGSLLQEIYEDAMPKDRYGADELKEARLLQQSLYDPAVMDTIVDRLTNDPVFRKRMLEL